MPITIYPAISGGESGGCDLSLLPVINGQCTNIGNATTTIDEKVDDLNDSINSGIQMSSVRRGFRGIQTSMYFNPGDGLNVMLASNLSPALDRNKALLTFSYRTYNHTALAVITIYGDIYVVGPDALVYFRAAAAEDFRADIRWSVIEFY